MGIEELLDHLLREPLLGSGAPSHTDQQQSNRQSPVLHLLTTTHSEESVGSQSVS